VPGVLTSTGQLPKSPAKHNNSRHAEDQACRPLAQQIVDAHRDCWQIDLSPPAGFKLSQVGPTTFAITCETEDITDKRLQSTASFRLVCVNLSVGFASVAGLIIREDRWHGGEIAFRLGVGHARWALESRSSSGNWR